MKKGEWTFLSNHGHVFEYLMKNPLGTTQKIATMTGLSIAGVQNIIADLREGDYVSIIKTGRRNQYVVHPSLSMHHPLEQAHCAGDVLKFLD
jgi:hypothetical protein